MPFIKHVGLFIKSFLTQLRRKWLSLPLLLLFPVILIGLIFTIIIAFFTPDPNEPIQIGLVDLDQSQETTLILEMISDSSELGSFIQINGMTESEAIDKIKRDQLHVYIIFPKDFTEHLYEGKQVNLAVIGNEQHPTESYLVNEIITSMTRLISAAQANILTINHYAKELSIDYDTRDDMLFEQFKDFLFYTLGKDKIIERESLINHATASPIHYYGLSAWFTMTIMWLLISYNFLYTEDTIRMKRRMKLYGVTDLQEKTARVCIALFMGLICSLISFIGLEYVLKLDLMKEDYIRIALTILLHSLIYLFSLAIIETLIKSQKMRLLTQSILTILLIIISGAIIPIIYFPIKAQTIAPHIFSHDAFFWIQEVILNNRYYSDNTPLLLNGLIGLFVLIGLSVWKERADN